MSNLSERGGQYWTIGEVMAGREEAFRDHWKARLEAGEPVPEIYIPMRRETKWLRRARRFMASDRPAFSRYTFIHITDAKVQLDALRAPGAKIELRLMRRPEFVGEFRIERVVAVPDREMHRLRMWEASGALDALPADAELRFERGTLLIVQGGALAGARVTVVRNTRIEANSVLVNLRGKRVSIPVHDLVGA